MPTRRADIPPRMSARRENGKTVVMGKRGATREQIAREIHRVRHQTEMLFGTVADAETGHFDQLTDFQRAMHFAVADLFIERMLCVVHALEFYRDASREQLIEDGGKQARGALAGKVP